MRQEQVVEASAMRDALLGLPGVSQVALELAGAAPGVLRIRLAPGADEAEVVSAALAGLRRAGGLDGDTSRLRLVSPDGGTVVAVVEPDARGTAPQPVGRPPAAPPPVVWQPLPQRAHATEATQPPPPAPPAAPAPPAPTSFDQLAAAPVARAGEDAARLVLERVEVASERLQMWATVHLARGDARYTGSAGASANGAGPHRAVAAATARAAESALGDDVRLDVEAVDVLAMGQDRIGVVIVTLLTERGLDRLTGAALVRGDGRETIVRATLDALNRRAESLGTERPPGRA